MNEIQRRFDELCKLGGGPKGGPARGKVQDLLLDGGRRLNAGAFAETARALKLSPGANPWHVMFAVALFWGHLATPEDDFFKSSVSYLGSGDAHSFATAISFPTERGSDPLRQSLSSGKALFEKVILPKDLPADLAKIGKAQERWLGHVISPHRPAYIGSWNATAMFMAALFAQPSLAVTMTTNAFMLPPGGPIWAALAKLHKVHVLPNGPAGNDLDDGAVEPGVLYENNSLMAKLLPGSAGLNMIDLHSGLYLLGTKHPHADSWI